MNEEMSNLVIVFSKKMGHSYNKVAKLVNRIVLDKLEEVHGVIANLRILTQSNNEITISQTIAIEQYILGCTSFIGSIHEFHTQSSRFHV
jgi:hypothetical protein